MDWAESGISCSDYEEEGDGEEQEVPFQEQQPEQEEGNRGHPVHSPRRVPASETRWEAEEKRRDTQRLQEMSRAGAEPLAAAFDECRFEIEVLWAELKVRVCAALCWCVCERMTWLCCVT